MRLRAAPLAMSAALLLAGMATAAVAAPPPPPPATDFIGIADGQPAPPSTPFSPPIPHKSYSFDNKGWGVNLDMEQPVNRQTELKDVTAGAYFKIGPRLKLGGSVVLGDRFAQPQQLTPQDTGPRVHLETKFQF